MRRRIHSPLQTFPIDIVRGKTGTGTRATLT
jgi:hypothetical protein